MILAMTILVIAFAMTGALVFGRAKVRQHQTMTEWAVGGRGFGMIIFWFLNAGEIYTTFAVLGIAGFAWQHGAPAYLAFTSVSLASAVGYWLMPKIWQAGKSSDLVTQADYFAYRYKAKWLGVVVGLAGIVALVVYVQIQIVALSLIIRLTLGPQVDPLTSATIAAAIMIAFVFFAGLRSAAFGAAVKDILMLIIIIGLSATAAGKVGATSPLNVFRVAQDMYPSIGHLPGMRPEFGLSTTWLMTSGLNVALGTWILPHMFQLCYAAKSRDAIRRNAIWQPLYSLSYFFVIMLGFAALLANVQAKTGDPNAALINFVAASYPPWAIGLFAGTACLLALVPGSILLLTAGSIFSRNVVRPLRPEISARSEVLISRGAMIVFAALAVYLAVGDSKSLVEIGLSAYAAIGMLAPGVFLGFLWPRAHALGVFAGIIAGYIALLLPASATFHANYFTDWDHGLVALIVGTTVTIVVSLVIPKPREAHDSSSS